MKLRIRPSQKADIAAIDALLQRSYPKLLRADYPPSVLVTALPLITRAQPRLLTCGTFYVAEVDGALLGAGGWTPDQRRKELGHVRHLVTDDRHLRKGIARALMETCFASSRAAGMRKMECWATRTAVPFYEAMGFKSRGNMVVPLAPGIEFPAVLMTRDL